jgi:hypothetical protein
MGDTCPVVQIADPKAPGGYVEINETDFDPKVHKLYVAPKVKEEPDTKKDAEAPKAEEKPKAK